MAWEIINYSFIVEIVENESSLEWKRKEIDFIQINVHNNEEWNMKKNVM